MAKQTNKPTPAGENSRTKAQAEAEDATQDDRKPVPASQDSAGPGRAADNDAAKARTEDIARGGQPHDSSPSEGGTVQGVPTGKLDQDRDGHAETPEVGQPHAAAQNGASDQAAKAGKSDSGEQMPYNEHGAVDVNGGGPLRPPA